MRQKGKIGEDMRQIFAQKTAKKAVEYAKNAHH
jgi:hypothetical protein